MIRRRRKKIRFIGGWLSNAIQAFQVAALEELEFHVHQYDNAVDFLQLNGITRGVLPALNSTSVEVR